MLKLLLPVLLLSQVVFADTKSDALKLFEKRDDEKSLVEALSKFEKAHAENPSDLDVLTYLSRGYFIYAEYFISKEKDKMANFEKARNFGEKALEMNADYKANKEKDIEKAIDKLTLKEIAPLFWTAASLGKWSKLNGVMSSLKYKGQILDMISKVGSLKGDFFYGSVPRYWGSFYAVAPSIAGGDMKKSKKNFEQAMQMAPEYLGTKRLYAEYYLVKEEEEKEFKKVLDEVIKAPEGPAEIAPENRLEKRVAEKLLKNVGDLF